MSRFVLRPALNLLRILIVAGALASVVEPQAHYKRIDLSLVSFRDRVGGVMTLDPHSLVRLALTAMTLSLL